jgi:hypothetical protein
MDAHEREYLGAVAAMGEYGKQRSVDDHAIGDFLTYRLSGWSDRSSETGQVRGHAGNVLLVMTNREIVRVLPCEVLPF